MGTRLTTSSCKTTFVTETETRENATTGDGRNAGQATGLMTDEDQSRKDVHTPTANLLKPKQLLKLGFWNVRTLYQTGKLAQAVNELNHYNLDLMGIAEARWTGSGKQQLATGETIIWSGRQDNNHHEGVALLLRKETAKTLLEWKPISERILYARFHSKFTKLSIIISYAQ